MLTVCLIIESATEKLVPESELHTYSATLLCGVLRSSRQNGESAVDFVVSLLQTPHLVVSNPVYAIFSKSFQPSFFMIFTQKTYVCLKTKNIIKLQKITRFFLGNFQKKSHLYYS